MGTSVKQRDNVKLWVDVLLVVFLLSIAGIFLYLTINLIHTMSVAEAAQLVHEDQLLKDNGCVILNGVLQNDEAEIVISKEKPNLLISGMNTDKRNYSYEIVDSNGVSLREYREDVLNESDYYKGIYSEYTTNSVPYEYSYNLYGYFGGSGNYVLKCYISNSGNHAWVDTVSGDILTNSDEKVIVLAIRVI